ncbi:hypothetical protein [Marinospirillum sp.]|uniref:hypothetical protein n=1 Tax=Marinospirillum sp. TaxID=2183934 RepID=UPI002870B334|nr:hypothetical protein [Marinospirillum sp.]MDR9469269.1 hypothetical protein [Marinospirillum sp.]
MKFANIETLINNFGEITIGKAGSVRCAAIASDEHQCLAILARRPDESLETLLGRLDFAIADALEKQIFTDEINR